MKEPFFCFRSNFRAITRLETLATQARFQVARYMQSVGGVQLNRKREFFWSHFPFVS